MTNGKGFKPVEEVPSTTKESIARDLLNAFIESGANAAEVTEDVSASALRSAAKRDELPVSVLQRGDTIYLEASE